MRHLALCVAMVLPLWVLPLWVLSSCRNEAQPQPPQKVEPVVADAAGVAVVLEITGVASQAGKSLIKGQSVSLEEEIEVKSGRLVLGLEDGSRIRVFPASRLKLPAKKKIRLLVGKVWAVVAKVAGQDLEIETGNAVAGVRGTEFVVEFAAADEKTRVSVIEGTVAVSNRKRTKSTPRNVKGGQSVVVAKEEEPEAKEIAPAADAEQWKELQVVEPAPVEPAPVEPVPVEPNDKGTEMDGKGKGKRKARVPNEMEREGLRQKKALQQEGDHTKHQLEKESKATETKLKQESKATKKKLDAEAAKTKRDMMDKDKALKGSAKDFLD